MAITKREYKCFLATERELINSYLASLHPHARVTVIPVGQAACSYTTIYVEWDEKSEGQRLFEKMIWENAMKMADKKFEEMMSKKAVRERPEHGCMEATNVMQT